MSTHHQVCPPGLHLTLGIFYRLWCLLEAACHDLDIELARLTSPLPTDRASYKQYSSLVKKLTQLSELRVELLQFTSGLTTALGDLAVQCAESDPRVQALEEEARKAAMKLDKVVPLYIHVV